MKDSPSTSAVEIYLDPATARAQKAQRLRQQNVVVIPALRMLGFAMIAGILLVHNELVLGRVDWPQYLAFVAVIFLYTVTSWLALYLFYRPFARIDLGFVFLISDIVF